MTEVYQQCVFATGKLWNCSHSVFSHISTALPSTSPPSPPAIAGGLPCGVLKVVGDGVQAHLAGDHLRLFPGPRDQEVVALEREGAQV